MEGIVTTQQKYNQWKVFHKGGDITIESTNKMSPQQALKHFKCAVGVIGVEEHCSESDIVCGEIG